MSGISKRLAGWAGGAAALAFLVGATSASATSIGPNYCLAGSNAGLCKMQLDIGNAAVSAYPGPYVAIDATIKNTSTLEFSVTSDVGSSGGNTYKYLFDNLAFYLEPTVSGVTAISVSKDEAGHQPSLSEITFGVSLNEDQFGNPFGNASVSVQYCTSSGHPCDNGFNKGLTSLVFDVSWSDKTWTDLTSQQFMALGSQASGCTVDGALGCSAAGHVYVATFNDGILGTTALATGSAAWPNCADQRIAGCIETPVPEPASLALLGSGLAAIGILRRRRDEFDPS